MMPIFFDLDGVIRNLAVAVFGTDPPHYYHTVDGKSLVDIVHENPRMLIDAPETEYCDYIRSTYGEIIILTAQWPDWLDRTRAWIKEHIPHSVVLNCKPSEKVRFIERIGGLLIEDSPTLSSYKNIILVNRAYNQEVTGCVRVYNPDELDRAIVNHIMYNILDK